MINGKTVLGFIPARGGSKGLRNKNILKFTEKPLIAHTIEAALESNICDLVMVSTDNEKIANIANKCGASVPFIRPASLATDESRMQDVIIHTMEWFERSKKKFDILLYLQPTCPLRKSMHIIQAFDVFSEMNADVIISVNKSKSIPQRVNALPKDRSMRNFVNENYQLQNRQEIPNYYELNGAIHITKWDVFRKLKSWYVEKSFAYIMDQISSIDIDDKIDMEIAECLAKK